MNSLISQNFLYFLKSFQNSEGKYDARITKRNSQLIKFKKGNVKYSIEYFPQTGTVFETRTTRVDKKILKR